METTLRDEFVPRGDLSMASASRAPLLPTDPEQMPKHVPGQSKRVGLIGKKIGMTVQWLVVSGCGCRCRGAQHSDSRLKNGTRVLCTMIHCPDNHVVSALD